MNAFTTALACSCIALASIGAQANETAAPTKAAMPSAKHMTLEECKQHMSAEEKNVENKGPAMNKEDRMCANMIKKSEKSMKKGDSATGDSMAK